MIFAGLMIWLQKRLGLFFGAMVAYAFKPILGKFSAAIIKYFKDRARAKRQEEAAKKLELDIEQGLPRNDEVRKNEQDFFNS